MALRLFLVDELRPSRERFIEEVLLARRADNFSSSLTAGVEGILQLAALVAKLDSFFALFLFLIEEPKPLHAARCPENATAVLC